MRIFHWCSSLFKNCGIGEFSINFNERIKQLFPDSEIGFSNRITITPREYDLLIVQYEPNLMKRKDIKLIKNFKSIKKTAFIHSKLTDYSIEKMFDSFICMNEGMIETKKEVFIHPCPGFESEKINEYEKEEVRKKNGIPLDCNVLGNFSMLSRHRELVRIVNVFRDSDKDTFLYINAATNSHSKENDLMIREIEKTMNKDKVIIDFNFNSNVSRNKIMQSCNFLWCFSRAVSNYSSASISDMYCSGTTLFYNETNGHKHIDGLPGAYKISTLNPDLFADTLSIIIKRETYDKSDSSRISWENSFGNLLESNGTKR